MTRTLMLLVLCGLLFAFCLPADAQQSAKILRIGYLERSTVSGSAVLLAAFRKELSKLGWEEGRNIVIESRFADQDIERLPGLAAELVRLKVDVIVTGGAGPTRSAKQATSTIPIVMAQGADPVGNGFVISLARPGGNVTGLSALSNDLATKRLEMLKDVVPRLARVGVFLPTPGDSLQAGLAQNELKLAALALKLNLEEIKTPSDPKGLEIAFQTAKQKRVGAIMTNDARTFLGQRKRMVELAGKHRLPAIYYQSEFVEEGGLMSYGADFGELYRRAAYYVDRVLKGTKPADLPVEQPTRFEFIINLKAAKQIGLTIPPNVLARADRVIR